ncbi:MAG: hypothetical protein ABSF18_04630 [Gammaproteobacteria bacterium]|jgi:uncharacterized lipoprotein
MVYKFWTGLALILLSGCSMLGEQYREFVPDRDTEYLEEEADDPLILPEGMTLNENYHSPYIIPDGPLPDLDEEPISLVPPGGMPLWERANEELEKAKARKAAAEEKEEEGE